MYRKRPCLSTIFPQLYETKLISLLYFRAIHDDTIEDFQIAANLENIGHFDDICLKFKVKGFDKPVAVFIQAKHRENKKHIFKIDLSTYFTSYLKIREHFDPYIKDLFFKDTFDETESFFVLYTTARDEFNDDSNVATGVCSILKDLIETGGTAKQPYKQEEHVKCLCEAVMKEQMTSLAELIAKFIYKDVEVIMLLHNEILLRYHVALARQVFDVSEIQPDGYRIATFRHDFFDTYVEYLTIFKDTLFKEILKNRKIRSTDIKSLLSEFLTKPTDIFILSKLIEIVVTYHNGFLEINKQYTEYFRPELKQVFVSQQTVDKAIELAAREMLLSSEFKLRVPAAFGNKDLMISGSDAKKAKRIHYLTSKVIDLLTKSKASNIVTLDNTLDHGFLQLNGGIAGAIGNIFVLDDNTKLMKVTDNCEQLGPLAKRLYTKLNSEIYNLHECKFDFKGNRFPKTSFDFNYEENLARDFLNRLLLYSNQAFEKDVEIILKKEIADYQRDQPNYLQVDTDAIFLQFHEQIQKWFINPNAAPYLTRTFNLYQYAINNIINDPLMSTINGTFKKKLKQYNYTFTEDAVSFLDLVFHSSIIITENSEITALKVLQHFKNEDHAVLDFEHIANLPTNVCDLLCTELLYMNEDKVLIFVYDTNSNHDLNKLEIILKAVRCKTTVVITNQTSLKIIQEYFPQVNNVIQDKNLCLIDLSVQSQMSLLENATVVFPGVEIKLDLLLMDWAETGSRFLCATAPGALQQSDDKDASTSQHTAVAAACLQVQEEVTVAYSTANMETLSSGQGNQVVTPSEEHTLLLDVYALQHLLLREDVCDRPVVLVSVAGVYMKGKSFLLDFFLRYLDWTYNNGEGGGEWLGKESESLNRFSWRGGSDRHTTGIHLWSQPFKANLPNGEKVVVLLMDTTFDSNSMVKDNAIVFALSTMLSSVQIYNISQNIKVDDLQHLQLSMEYGRVAKDEIGGKPFQRLQFLVRDWSYPHDHPYGAVGGEQLLKKRLTVREVQHEVRQDIARCFEEVTCFLMPYPGTKVSSDPQFSGKLSDIDGEFKSCLKQLVPMLLAPENLVTKKIGGQTVKARDLLNYFKSYVEVFNGEELPDPMTILQKPSEDMDPVTTLKELINAIEEGDKEKLKEKINLFHQDLNRHKQILCQLYKSTSQCVTQTDLILAACCNKQADILHYLLNETDILDQLPGADYNDTEVIRQRTEAFKHALIWDDFSMVEMLYDYWSGDLHWIGHDVNKIEMLGNVLKDARVVCVVETQQLLLDVHSLSKFNAFQRELYSSISKTTPEDTASMILEMLRIYDEYSKIENVRLPNEDVVQEKELQDHLKDKTSEYMSIQAYISYEFYYRKLDFNVALLILDNTFVLRKDLKERFNKPKIFFAANPGIKSSYQDAVSLYKNVECALYHFIYCTSEDWRLYLPRDRKIVKQETHGIHKGRIIFPIIITSDEHKLENGPILFLERKNFKKCVNDLKDLLHHHIKNVDPAIAWAQTQTKVGKTSKNKEKIEILLDDNYLTPTMYMSDYYSLSKIVYYIKAIENTHDINVLMIERILQVTGEMLKSTKTTCHLSESTKSLLQIPVDTIKYLRDIRTFLSKVDEGQLSTRIDIANNQAQVFHDIKKDLKIIEQMINSVLDVYKHILDKALLEKGLALLDEQIKNMSISSLHFDVIDKRYNTYGEQLIDSDTCKPLLQELSNDTGLTVQLLNEFFWIRVNKDIISPKIKSADTSIGERNVRTTTFCKNLAENNTFDGIKKLHEIFKRKKQKYPPRDELISCLISRVNQLKIILQYPQVELEEHLRTYKHDKTFRFGLEMIVADIANVLAQCNKTSHLKYQTKEITKKSNKLLRDIDLGNLLDHGNPFLDVIANVFDSYDLSTALLLKAIMFAKDGESIEALLKLFQGNIYYDTIKNGKLADMDAGQKTLYQVFTKSPNWEYYVELVPKNPN